MTTTDAPPALTTGVCLGTYLIATGTGWERWYDAQGPLDVHQLTLALDASAEALHHLDALPTRLRGLSLAGLPVTDDDLRRLARRCQQLRWLDLRGTQVTAAGLGALAGIRPLRRIGVDPHLLLTRDPRRPARRSAGRQLVGGDRPLAVVNSGVPAPDLTGLHETVRAAVRDHPGPAAREPDEAVARARVLLDADQPAAGLALVAPFLATAEPAVLIVTARCLLKLNQPTRALAALVQAPPTGAVLAWRAVVLTTLSPPEAARVAKAALRETIENQVAEWALVTAYLNRGQLEPAEQALRLLRSRTYDEIDEAKLSARLARARRRYREETDAWHRLLRVVPDDADALAGLARAQRSARPWSMRWVGTLNRAAGADVGKYGRRMMEQVSGHRVTLAVGVGLLSWPALSLLLVAAAPHARNLWGWSIALALLAGNLTGLTVWRLTPPEVRRLIRNADRLTGRRHGPSWRWALGGLLIGVTSILTVPSLLPLP
ncbi:hypothetical protein KIH74_17730 [Kineosporia sp. J2-2]|uniref:Uncharacterized protein n=1 Tax=Kineosporia corallincola TaxID=2835133 RepID=A0ABS5TL42_9ACTN|nr:hypothetical protein [Kineosporia corallincola]MBT0770788.1 hypothetical protein [Kineosporia corallincola]